MARGLDFVWHDRKRTFFGLPLSFTRYYLTEEKLIISKGLFNTNEEEIRLYRILDLSLKRTLGEKILQIGTVHVCSADKSTPEFDIERVKKPIEFKELLSDLVEKERTKKMVTNREYMADSGTDMDYEHFH